MPKLDGTKGTPSVYGSIPLLRPRSHDCDCHIVHLLRSILALSFETRYTIGTAWTLSLAELHSEPLW